MKQNEQAKKRMQMQESQIENAEPSEVDAAGADDVAVRVGAGVSHCSLPDC